VKWKIEKLIEFLTENYNPSDVVFVPAIYDKNELLNIGSYEPTSDEWDEIVGRMGSDYAFDTLWEDFTSAVSNEIGHLYCDECYEYHASTKIIDEDSVEKFCSNCVITLEKNAELEKQAIAEKERLEKIRVLDENIIY
jgi:hypothetical protein